MNLQQHIQGFNDDGFLVLEQFLQPESVDRLQGAIDRQLSEDDGLIVVDDLDASRRTFLGLCQGHQSGRYKYNDLYLDNEELRQIVMQPDLVALLNALLSQPVVLCNSLYFLRGSSQGFHVDSLYMTPHTVGSLAAIWVALEDVHESAGPLTYYPGSHRFRPHLFSDGTQHARHDEMPAWSAHVQSEIERAGVSPRQFLARRGDVFIWHADLLHGGGRILDPQRTRRSLVCHFYTLSDCEQIGWAQALEPLNSGFWLNRSPPAVPLGDSTDWIGTVPFPETRYLERNPDVHEAVKKGQLKSGLQHFLTFGHRENRLA